ncbi:MAG: hypothetical protein WD355_05420 [Balneolaceae bacterium]
MSVSRKEILRYLAGLPVFGAFAGISGSKTDPKRISATPRRDYFNELGVRKLINARGAYTTLTGSLMTPEVVDAIQYASDHFVSLIELNEKAGARIAEMLNCEDAHVSAGAASAITLATAAALTGRDREKMRAIPHLPGPQKEVILPRGHRIYEQQFTACGVKLVEVNSAREMERAMNVNTVLAFYYNAYRDQKISREEFVRIGREHEVPTFNDCASDVPPVENLFKYIEMGFDLVTFSGGKGISGPQSAGLLFGRKDLIEAARMNHSPYGSIGRGMKVDKEEIIGIMVALEVYLKKDHDNERATWESWVSRLQDVLSDIRGVSTEMYLPPVANHVPHLRITWEHSVVKTTPGEVVQKLRHGHPSIEVMASEEDITLNMFMVQPHEVDIIGQRTKQVLMESV